MDKTCSIVQDLLPLYEEDMLREETKEFVDGHLAQCAACRAELDALKADVKPAPVSAQPLRDLKRQLRRKKLTAVLLAVTVFTTSRTVSMVWLTVRLPSAAMVSTVFTSLRTPSTIWRLVEVMTCFCWVVPLDSVSVTVSVVVVTPSLTAVVVSLMDLTMSAVACFVLLAAEVAAAAAAVADAAAPEEPELRAASA